MRIAHLAEKIADLCQRGSFLDVANELIDGAFAQMRTGLPLSDYDERLLYHYLVHREACGDPEASKLRLIMEVAMIEKGARRHEMGSLYGRPRRASHILDMLLDPEYQNYKKFREKYHLVE